MKRYAAALAIALVAGPAAAERTVCIVAHQQGPIRNIPANEAFSGPYAGGEVGPVEFDCAAGDNAALLLYLHEIKRHQDEQCPRCFPNGEPWVQQ